MKNFSKKKLNKNDLDPLLIEIELAKKPNQQQLKALHKKRLNDLKIKYVGIRRASPQKRNHRVTHCWSCKKNLDNSIDFECMSCGWILCRCGACGCGYKLSLNSYHACLDANEKPKPKIIAPKKTVPIILPPQKIGNFIVQDNIATDTKTSLMWLRFAHGQRWKNGKVVGKALKLNWHDAMEYPSTFNKHGYAGYKDWRVPNIDELKTLIDIEKRKDVFPGNYDWFWSSSSGANFSNACFIYFGGCLTSSFNGTSDKYTTNLIYLVRSVSAIHQKELKNQQISVI
jgi:hypothetical protein